MSNGALLRSRKGTNIYYLSVTPQCLYLDDLNPASMLQLLDFAWAQFYNDLNVMSAQAGSCHLFATRQPA